MKKLLFPILLCLVVIAGCKKEKSKTADPDHIQQEIWSIYDADNGDSYFGIRFYDLDWYTRVILTPPSNVTLNGNIMNLNTLNSYYESRYDNEQVPSGIFVYTDAWNRVITNTTVLESSIELPAIDTLYKNRDNVITWIGEPCSGSTQTITVQVGILIPVATIKTNVSGATTITIKGSDLSLWMSDASIRIYIERTTTVPLQQATPAGGSINMRYSSVIKRVYIK